MFEKFLLLKKKKIYILQILTTGLYCTKMCRLDIVHRTLHNKKKYHEQLSCQQLFSSDNPKKNYSINICNAIKFYREEKKTLLQYDQ
jgi:hypothetical protein